MQVPAFITWVQPEPPHDTHGSLVGGDQAHGRAAVVELVAARDALLRGRQMPQGTVVEAGVEEQQQDDQSALKHAHAKACAVAAVAAAVATAPQSDPAAVNACREGVKGSEKT